MKRLPVVALIPLLLLAQFLLPSAFAQWSGAQISVVPTSIQCGNSISVSGSGWPANSTVTIDIVQLSPAYVTPVQVQTDRTGSFSNAQLGIPSTVRPGNYTVSAQTGSTTPVTAPLTVTCEVVANAQITSIVPNPAPPGSTVTLSAIDLPVGTTVSAVITCNGGNTQATGTVDSNGQLSLSFEAPSSAASGQCQVQLEEGSSTLATGTFQVQQTATFTLNPSAVPAGGSVTVSGTSFLPNSSVTAQVTIALSGGGTQTVTQGSVTDGSGNFSLTLSVPGNALPGSYLVGAYQNGATNASATATLTVTQATAIQLVPSTQVPATAPPSR